MDFSDPDLSVLRIAVFSLLWLAFWLVPVAAGLFAAYFFMTLPMRRQERARLFLDLLESSLRDGRGVEPAILAMAASRDRSLGVRFHVLACHLETGCRLSEALDRVPRFLPPQVKAMLQAGARLGDLTKVMPACRQLLPDAKSQTRGATNYLLLMLAYVVIPTGLSVLTMFEIYVLPQFAAVAQAMQAPAAPAIDFIMRHRTALTACQLGLVGVVWLLAFLYVGGPRLSGWLGEWFAPLVSRIQYAVPWRRKRMQRDFSAMLAVLLDTGVPEPEALALAAGCTVNAQFQQRASRAAEELKAGRSLPEAVRAIDDTGEFHWRLTNVCHVRGGFSQALAGWNSALDAKAFQQEQAAAQLVTTGLVLLNGAIVGFVVVAVFQVLTSVVDSNLW